MDEQIRGKIEDFFSPFPTQMFKKDEHVYRPNDIVPFLYYVTSGQVRQYSVAKSGEEITHHIFTDTALFPITLTLIEKTNAHYFDATKKTITQKAPVKDFLSFLKNDTDVLFYITQLLAKRAQGLLTKTESILFEDAEHKVASILFYLSQKLFPSKVKTISIDTSHHEIASWTGIQRETVTRQIEKLKEKGLLITVGHNIIIPDLEKMRKFLASDVYQF